MTLLDYELAATTLKPRKIKARNRVISQFDMIGVTSTERLAVVRTRMMPAKSTTGDTPLRVLLEGLAQTAVADAWKDSLAAQISEKSDQIGMLVCKIPTSSQITSHHINCNQVMSQGDE